MDVCTSLQRILTCLGLPRHLLWLATCGQKTEVDVNVLPKLCEYAKVVRTVLRRDRGYIQTLAFYLTSAHHQNMQNTVSNTLPWPWFDSPNFEEQLSILELNRGSQDIIRGFANDGYAIVDLEIDGFDQLSQEIIDNLEYKEQFRLHDAWKCCEAVRNLAIHSNVLSILRTIYQRDPLPFQTLNFRIGTQQKAHSDTAHFQSIPKGFMCGVWIALEDIDSGNGPLLYYPKSHKLPTIEPYEIGLKTIIEDSENYKLYENFIERVIQDLKLEKVEAYIKKGTAIIWAANLLHGGSAILDRDRTRHSQVTHYYFDGCLLHYNPLQTDPFSGKIRIRDRVPNICTGEEIVHYYSGEKTVLGSGKKLAKRLLRRFIQ